MFCLLKNEIYQQLFDTSNFPIGTRVIQNEIKWFGWKHKCIMCKIVRREMVNDSKEREREETGGGQL